MGLLSAHIPKEMSLGSSSSSDYYLEYGLGCESSNIIRSEQSPRNSRITTKYLGLWMTKSWTRQHYSRITVEGGDWKDKTAGWPLSWTLRRRHLSLSPIFGMWVLLAFLLPEAAPRHSLEIIV